MFGIYDPQIKKAVTPILTVPQTALPQDEKFHFYYLGRVKFAASALLWVHQSWYMGVALKDLASADPAEECDVYVSLKVQGPSYVKNSNRPDDIALDRVVAVPVENSEVKVNIPAGSLVK